MSRRLEAGESKVIAYAPSTNHPMEIKAATIPRYSDVPVATPKSVRGIFNRFSIDRLFYCFHWLIISTFNCL